MTDPHTVQALNTLLLDPEKRQALVRLQAPADARKYLADHGIALTLDEVTALGQTLAAPLVRQNAELSEDALACVAGGYGGVGESISPEAAAATRDALSAAWSAVRGGITAAWNAVASFW